MYLVDLLGGTEAGVYKLVFCKFPIAEGVQSLVAIAEVGYCGVLNILNFVLDFQGDGIRVVTKEAMTDEFRSR